MRKITERERILIEKLDHPLYTVDYLEQWADGDYNPLIHALEALRSVKAKGYLEAIQAMIAAEDRDNAHITLEMVAEGYKTGLIKLVNSPNDDGTVCQIGSNWFYFGGLEAEGVTPNEYKDAVPEEDIVSEIYSVLDDFRKSGEEFLDEYRYYAFYIQEGGISSNISVLENIIKPATFTSVWDGGYEITTNCKVNTETKEVFDIEPSEGTADMVNELDDEYVTIDGVDYPVSNDSEETEYWYN